MSLSFAVKKSSSFCGESVVVLCALEYWMVFHVYGILLVALTIISKLQSCAPYIHSAIAAMLKNSSKKKQMNRTGFEPATFAV